MSVATPSAFGAAPSEAAADSLRSDRLTALVLALAIVSYVLEGPIRFVLHSVSAEMLLYSRDALAAVVVGSCLLSWALGQRSVAPLAGAVGILLVHLAIGMVTLPQPFQALMGMKIFLWFLLGFAAAPFVARRRQALVRVSWFVFLITALGVVLNRFIAFPWIGLSYETSFGATEASKQWWAAGVLRLPGFARASFNAAMFMLVSLPALFATNKGALRRILLIAVAGVVFVFTTTKGAWTGAAMIAFDAVLCGLGLQVVANVGLCALASFCLLLPLVAVQVGASPGSVPGWALSFVERIRDMWPRAFALVTEPGQVLWGRGLGGIGVGQNFGEWNKSDAADNLMVYVLVTFGMLGICYIGAFLFRFVTYRTRGATADLQQSCVRGWTALWFAYGLTTNMIEEPMMNMAIGVAFGTVFAIAD
jgi:hypothetical protein